MTYQQWLRPDLMVLLLCQSATVLAQTPLHDCHYWLQAEQYWFNQSSRIPTMKNINRYTGVLASMLSECDRKTNDSVLGHRVEQAQNPHQDTSTVVSP